LHGGFVTDEVNVAQHVDLLIGVAPSVNLEWIQKIHRDSSDRGYSHSDIIATIVRRMPDYATFVAPQFSRSDINFQRVPIVDTSNPFDLQEIPDSHESVVIVHIRRPEKFTLSIDELRERIDSSFNLKPNQLVMPAEKMAFAMEVLLAPVIKMLVGKYSVIKSQAG
jgi:phosphoribulokinase